MRRLFGKMAVCGTLIVQMCLLGSTRASVLDLLFDEFRAASTFSAPGELARDPLRRLLLNQVPLTIMTGYTRSSVGEVLDHYQAIHRGGLLEKYAGGAGGVRRGNAHGGFFFTVEVRDPALAEAAMHAKLPLSSAGALRMIYVQRSGDVTHYLTITSDKALPLGALQPVKGVDAPGTDIPNAPRPAGTRILSLEEPKAGYRLVTYEVPMTEGAALSLAIERVTGAGFREDHSFRSAAEQHGRRIVRLSNGKQDLLISVRSAARGVPDCRVTYLSRTL